LAVRAKGGERERDAAFIEGRERERAEKCSVLKGLREYLLVLPINMSWRGVVQDILFPVALLTSFFCQPT
jgi:hypothetical protein